MRKIALIFALLVIWTVPLFSQEEPPKEIVNISPYGTGDVFSFKSDEVTNVSIQIYNLFGVLVFEKKGFPIKWNGLDMKGKVVAAGTYAYIINGKGLEGESFSRKGSIDFIR